MKQTNGILLGIYFKKISKHKKEKLDEQTEASWRNADLPHLLPGVETIVLHRPRIKDFWFHRHGTGLASIMRDGMLPRGEAR